MTRSNGGHSMRLSVRGLVGLIPLYATLTLEPSVVNCFPAFKKHMNWVFDSGPEMSRRNMANIEGPLFFLLFNKVSSSWSWQALLNRTCQQGPPNCILRKDARRERVFDEHGIRSYAQLIWGGK
ncbi:hypothetical protein H4582DRAFT_1928074 [Lactarius indigo]|nr:hypothetical protein H4582DRAFT_1928074 [Lactarius indigo]